MRNLLLILIAAVCVYLYTHPAQEAAPVAEQTFAAPVQTGPKFYYHSPLEAAAMPSGVSTGMGYYSTDQDARFNNYQYHSQVGGGQSAAGGPTLYGGGSSTSSVYYSSSASSNLNNAPRSYGNGSGNAQSNGSYQGR